MPIYKYISGSRRKVKTVWRKTVSGWSYISRVVGKIGSVDVDILRTEILTISSNIDNYNIFTAAGSPPGAADVFVTINSGVIVGSTSASLAALSAGSGWAAGSTLTIINNGQIIGKGAGAPGGAAMSSCTPQNGSNGLQGGDALDLTLDTDIDNTNGNVFGGGGSGGASASQWTSCSAGEFGHGGSGGGGGAGDNGGAGGPAGVCSGCFSNTNGAAGSAGGTSGGAGGVSGAFIGGNGGGYGAAGTSGSSHDSPLTCAPITDTTGGSGGAGGKAVDLNGSSITWLGGNNGTQVKGAVS